MDGSKTERGVGAGVHCVRPGRNFSISLGLYCYALLLYAEENIRMRYCSKFTVTAKPIAS